MLDSLFIRAYLAVVKIKRQGFNFILPTVGYSFDSFKTKLFEECELIRPHARRFTAYRIIKRFTMNSNKLFFKKDKKFAFRKNFRKTFAFFKLKMSASLALALGSPAKNISVTHLGQVTLSHFLQGRGPQSPFTFVHFRPKKTVSIKCQEVDLANHLDNVLYSVNIKLYAGFRRYTQKRRLFFPN